MTITVLDPTTAVKLISMYLKLEDFIANLQETKDDVAGATVDDDGISQDLDEMISISYEMLDVVAVPLQGAPISWYDEEDEEDEDYEEEDYDEEEDEEDEEEEEEDEDGLIEYDEEDTEVDEYGIPLSPTDYFEVEEDLDEFTEQDWEMMNNAAITDAINDALFDAEDFSEDEDEEDALQNLSVIEEEEEEFDAIASAAQFEEMITILSQLENTIDEQISSFSASQQCNTNYSYALDI